MNNYLIVNIEGSYQSIFYWSDLGCSLASLKQKIQQRFQIRAQCQGIFHQGEVLDEHSFYELYSNRVQGNAIELDLVITDAATANLKNDIHLRRIEICQNSSIHIRSNLLLWRSFLKFKAKAGSTVLDLKKHIQDLKGIAMQDIVLVIDCKKILADDQFLSDLLLDQGSKDVKLDILLVKTKQINRNVYYRMLDFLSRVEITIPGTEKDFKIQYPLPEIGSLNVEDVKSWIEHHYQVPCEIQELVTCKKGCTQLLDTENLMFNNDPLQVRLLVYSAPNTQLDTDSEMKENKIRTLKPVQISSFTGGESQWIYHYQGDYCDMTIEKYIECNLGIPQYKQRLFYQGKRISDQDLLTVLRSNNSRNEDPFIRIKLAVQANDNETKLLVKVKELGLSRLRSIQIKHPNSENILFECSLVRWYAFRSTREEYYSLCLRVSQELDLPLADFGLSHSIGYEEEQLIGLKPKMIDICQCGNIPRYRNDFQELMIQEDQIEENLTFTLVLKPSLDPRSLQFCKNQGLQHLKQLDIKFLAGQFTIDLSLGDIRTIKDLKNHLYQTKDILPHLQILHHENAPQRDNIELASFSHLPSSDSIQLTLIVKPPKEMTFRLRYRPLFNEDIPITMIESETISDLKDRISEQTSIPKSLITINIGGELQHLTDSMKFCYCKFENDIVLVTRMVKVLVIKNEKVVTQFDHRVRNNAQETVQVLLDNLQREHGGAGSVCLAKRNNGEVALNTKLCTIGEEGLEFMIRSKNTKRLVNFVRLAFS